MLLRTFGGLVLEDSGFTRPKPLLLLTFLALEGPQNRRHLAELFWPEAADRLKSLTVALVRLRKGAPGAVDADNERAWATVKTDAERLLTFLEQGELEKALELYQGPFLQGFYLCGWSAELEEWVYKTREFLAGRVRGAMLDLAEQEAARAGFQKAAEHAESACTLKGAPELEPEELSRLYTLLCAGNSPYAAEVRNEASAFDIDLVRSAEDARERLLQVSASRTPHNLPARGTAFVGRDLELAEVATLLFKPHCQLLTLVGPAGVGKTRLALQVAQEQLSSGSFQDGIYVVSLTPLAAPNLIPTTVADALGLELQGPNASLRQVIDHIGDKNLLLILDSFEHLMDGATITSDLVETCSNLKLLVTSQERLNVEEEHIFPVTGLPYPQDDNLTFEEAQHFDAVRLFVRRAKRAHPDFELTKDNLPDVLRICRLVEGLPLGLELAAVWVRAMLSQDIAQEIEENLDVLTTPTRNVPERHQSLRSAFEHSWALLTPKEQGVLRRLAVFRGGFRREAASEVAGATIPVLASLVDKSLLRADSTGRYHRHRLLYHYTQEKLAQHPDERAQVQDGHGAYYFRFLRKWGEKLRGGKQKEALLVIEEEVENIRVAWRWAIAGKRLVELREGCEPLQRFYHQRGLSREGAAEFSQAIAGLDETNPDHHAVLGRLLVGEAWFWFLLADYDRSAGLAERGLKLLRPLGESTGIARGLNALGNIAVRRGDFARAEGYFKEALALAKEQHDLILVANYTNNVALAQSNQGLYPEAERHFREALVLNQALGNHGSIVRNLTNLGVLMRATDNPEKAERLHQQALLLAREMGFQQSVPGLLNNLGSAAYELGQYERARALCQEALALGRESGERAFEADVLCTLGRIAGSQADYSQAQRHFRRALEAAWVSKDLKSVCETLIGLAELCKLQGNTSRAARLLSLVQDNPAVSQPNQRLRKLAEELQALLSPEELTEALKQGKAMKLEDVVEKTLAQAKVSP